MSGRRCLLFIDTVSGGGGGLRFQMQGEKRDSYQHDWPINTHTHTHSPVEDEAVAAEGCNAPFCPLGASLALSLTQLQPRLSPADRTDEDR